MSQKLIILRGTPASGKTTIAKKMRSFENKVAWLKVDNFKLFFAEDATSALDYVNGASIATLNYLLKNKFTVVMDGVFQNTIAIDQALKMAQEQNIPSKVFELLVSLPVLLKRDLIREGVPEGHRKPLGEEVITNIYKIIKDNPYPSAVQLDTENNSVEDCIETINSRFE